MNPQTNVEHISSFRKHTMRVQIGDICCAISCGDTEVFDSLRKLFTTFLTDQPADISIELSISEQSDSSQMEASLPETRYIHEGNHFLPTSRIIASNYDLANRTISMCIESNPGNPILDLKLLNQLLYLAYFSAWKLRNNGNPRALLVHACGILRDGHALVFTGPSEAGKTTIAHLCGEQNGQVINDEMLLISRPEQYNNMLKVQGIPIVGEYPQRLNVTAPLSCILLLKQSNKTRIHSINRTEAYLRFIRQIITPAYIGPVDKRAVLSLMVDFTGEVTGTIPIYELEFSLDSESLWREVGKLERALEGRDMK
jgi:hypothetical protein